MSKNMNELIENTETRQDIVNVDNTSVDNTTAGNEEANWLDSLPDELKSSKSLQRFQDVTTLAQCYLEAEKNVAQRVTLPGDEATEEEWQKFYARVGLPEDKKYLEERVEEDEEFVKTYENMFYRQGLSKKQGEQLLKEMYKYSTDLQTKNNELQKQEVETIRNSNINWLKNTYGTEFDSKLTVMQAALSRFGTRELAGLIEETGYSPALIDVLVKFGETLKPDSLITGNEASSITSVQGAEKEIKKLESDKEFMVKYRNKSSQGHEEAVNRLEELYRIVYNDKK